MPPAAACASCASVLLQNLKLETVEVHFVNKVVFCKEHFLKAAELLRVKRMPHRHFHVKSAPEMFEALEERTRNIVRCTHKGIGCNTFTLSEEFSPDCEHETPFPARMVRPEPAGAGLSQDCSTARMKRKADLGNPCMRANIYEVPAGRHVRRRKKRRRRACFVDATARPADYPRFGICAADSAAPQGKGESTWERL